MYSCASALKATIRTVTFTYNGTGIAALNITSASPKTYPSPGDMPVWGVETISSGQDYTMVQPLWGVLGNATAYAASAAAHAKVDNFSTITQQSLYLPGFMDNVGYVMTQGLTSVTSTTQNMPGLNFYAKALQMALSITSPGNSINASINQGGPDYSGFSSMALFAKWQNLTSSADTAGRVIDLVWTDYSANSVVGTRGWGLGTAQETGKGTSTPSEVLQVKPKSVPVTIYRRVVRYHLPFAVPAFVTLAALIAILGFLLVLVARRKSNAGRMRSLLEATSVGRVVAMGLWPDKMQGATPRNKGMGIEQVGYRRVRVTSSDGFDALDGSEDDGQDERDDENASAVDIRAGPGGPLIPPKVVSKIGIENTVSEGAKEK